MNILGISAYYHESACCLLQDGRLVAAAEEERFSRIKHDPRLPVSAFGFCLEAGGLSVADVDCVAYYESPVKKLLRLRRLRRHRSEGPRSPRTSPVTLGDEAHPVPGGGDAARNAVPGASTRRIALKRRLALTLGLATAAVSVLPRLANAQPAVEARLGVALDALQPGAFEGETRGTVQGSFAPEVGIASQHGRLFYQFDGGSFNTPGDWSFLNHALGASYRMDLGSAEKARLFVGSSGSWRRNGDAWSEADYGALAAFANLELRPGPGVTLRTGYRLADRSFAQLTELDQLEQDAFASLNVNLQSRTTLIAESHFAWKSYQGETLYDAAPAPTPTSPGAPSGSGRGWSGAGMGPGVRATLPLFVPTGTAGEHARQWNALLRVAQGLGARTGAWAQGFVRRTGGRVPPAIVTTPAGFFDDGVYDDPFASDLGALSGALKRVFAGGAELQASGSWQKKDFTAVVALDAAGVPLAGDPLRSDRITRGGISLSLPVPAPDTFALALALEYGFTRSRSNDAFYDYRNHAVGLALTLSR